MLQRVEKLPSKWLTRDRVFLPSYWLLHDLNSVSPPPKIQGNGIEDSFEGCEGSVLVSLIKEA